MLYIKMPPRIFILLVMSCHLILQTGAVTCDPGWTFEATSGQCFRFFDEDLTYTGGKELCKSNSADMAKPKTKILNRFFVEFFSELYLWLPLKRDDSGDGTYRWEDDDTVPTWSDWRISTDDSLHNDPRECAISMYRKWNPQKCTDEAAVICQRAPPPEPTVTSTESTADKDTSITSTVSSANETTSQNTSVSSEIRTSNDQTKTTTTTTSTKAKVRGQVTTKPKASITKKPDQSSTIPVEPQAKGKAATSRADAYNLRICFGVALLLFDFL